mgnify:CR=1 FL=1
MSNEETTKYAADWFARGNDDLKTIEALLKNNGIPNIVCFHAQQAAEKYLKGFLANHEKYTRKIHDLEALVVACRDIFSAFEELRETGQFLNQFYIESRYPDDYVEFTADDARKSFEAALHIKEFVLQKLDSSGKPSGFTLISIIIVIAAIAALAGGGLYFKEAQEQKSLLEAEPDEMLYCESDNDCTIMLCMGPANKEWARSSPPEPPCAQYYGYTALCIAKKCTAIKK